MGNRLRDNKLLFYLYQIYKLIVYFPLLGIGWSIMFIFFLIFIFLGAKIIPSRVAILWARYGSFITPMSVEIIGLENLDPSRSYVMVANHQSQYDIFLIYGWIPVDFKWVMKKELRKVPIIGTACDKLGHVFIDRANHEAALRAIQEVKSKIKDGTSIMFFPEGTRSMDGRLLDFKKGAFKFAVDIGLPVLPMTIIGTKDILPDKTTALFPGKASLVIHRPIPIESFNDANLINLMQQAKEAIQAGLDEYAGS